MAPLVDTFYPTNGPQTIEIRGSDFHEPPYEEALSACRETLGDRHPDTLTSINSMGVLLQDMGQLEEARLLYKVKEALQTCRETLGDRHPDIRCPRSITWASCCSA